MKRLLFVALAITFLTGAYATAQMAVFIDGADFESYISAPAGPCFDKDICCPFTIEAWFKPFDTNGERMIINKEDTWETASQQGTFQSAVARAKDDGRNGGWTWHDSELNVGVNVWNHGAMSWDPPKVLMYLNGKEGAIQEWAGQELAWAHEDTFKIGRRERGGATHSIFEGLIDEVRISKGQRYKGDYDVPKEEFVPDADTTALYHLNEIEGAATTINAAKDGGAANPCPDGTLEGAVELLDVGAGSGHEQPFEPFAVEPGGKMTTAWGHVKQRSVR